MQFALAIFARVFRVGSTLKVPAASLTSPKGDWANQTRSAAYDFLAYEGFGPAREKLDPSCCGLLLALEYGCCLSISTAPSPSC